MRQLGYSIEDVNVSERADEPELYLNRRSEIAWRFRQAPERGVSLPADDGLISELSAFRYDFDVKGRIRLEKKNETRRKLGRSPDKADAALLGFEAASRSLGKYAYVGGQLLDLDRGEFVQGLDWTPPF